MLQSTWFWPTLIVGGLGVNLLVNYFKNNGLNDLAVLAMFGDITSNPKGGKNYDANQSKSA